MQKNTPAQSRGGALRSKNCTADITNNSQTAQRLRLLTRLLTAGSITTTEARDQENIMHPAGRIKELRDDGHKIVTTWVLGRDHFGRTHRMGRYVLMGSGKP